MNSSQQDSIEGEVLLLPFEYHHNMTRAVKHRWFPWDSTKVDTVVSNHSGSTIEKAVSRNKKSCLVRSEWKDDSVDEIPKGVTKTKRGMMCRGQFSEDILTTEATRLNVVYWKSQRSTSVILFNRCPPINSKFSHFSLFSTRQGKL